MTLEQVYKFGKDKLKSIYNYDMSNEIVLLMQKCFNITKNDIIINHDKTVDDDKFKEFLSFVNRRLNKEPLQYILGKWSFMGNGILVGPGVFIPRYDTETLVEETIKLIDDDKNCKIIELCAGSGAISIALSKIMPALEISAIEKSTRAFEYLLSNIKMNDCNVKAINADIFDYINEVPDESIDVLVSNPPYIRTNDIDDLDDEVKMEPIEALDGGCDGLTYYREISGEWKKKVKKNGFLIVEIGFDQGNDVKSILELDGFKEISIIKDLSAMDRVVVAKK